MTRATDGAACPPASEGESSNHRRSMLTCGLRLLTPGLVLAAGLLAGCEREETLLDVETPDGGIEVQRNIDSGKIDVEVED